MVKTDMSRTLVQEPSREGNIPAMDLPPILLAGKQASAAMPPRKRFIGHKMNLPLYIIIGILVIMYIALLMTYLDEIGTLRTENKELTEKTIALRAERDQYKSAYETAVEDAQAFGRLYEANYQGAILNAENISANASQGPEVRVSSAKKPPTSDVWAYYNQRGVISDTCLLTTKIVHTPSDTVDIAIIAQGMMAEQWPRLSLFIDGTVITNFDIASSSEVAYKTTVTLAKGTHYLDLVYVNGGESITIPLVRIGERTLENAASVIDHGTGFGMLDCKNVTQGDTLSGPGAMRYRIEKV